MHEITRATRLSNSHPFKQIGVSNNVYNYSFHPRTIITWNNLPINKSVNIMLRMKLATGKPEETLAQSTSAL